MSVVRVHCQSAGAEVDERSQTVPTAKNVDRLQFPASRLLHVAVLGGLGRCLGQGLQSPLRARRLFDVSDRYASKTIATFYNTNRYRFRSPFTVPDAFYVV